VSVDKRINASSVVDDSQTILQTPASLCPISHNALPRQSQSYGRRELFSAVYVISSGFHSIVNYRSALIDDR